jgi:predicted metal-dependent hydrolase
MSTWFQAFCSPVTSKPAALFLADTRLAKVLKNESLASRVVVDFNARARRMSLRVDPINGCIVLVRPKCASDKIIMTFLASKVDWIAQHLGNLPPRVAFADGASITYRGEDHIIRFAPEAKCGVWREGREIFVAGRTDHTSRRLQDWMKAQARVALTPVVHDFAKVLGVIITRITVRDTRSRWGSCTPDGKLAFSWRLILAPPDVLTYVAAHEVAHLRHMNHGPAFWDTVEMLLSEMPLGKGEDWALAREWLRRSGATLHRYG